MNREGFFKPGNKYSKGRPPKSRSQLGFIRDRILRVVRRRLMREKDLDTVTTTELLKFLATIMPKDVGLSLQVPQVNYISNVPRQELITTTVDLLDSNIEETEKAETDNNGSDNPEGSVHSDPLHTPVTEQG